MANTSTPVDEAAIEAAIGAFTKALGAESVLTAADELREYRDPYDYKGSDRYTASAVLTPSSVEEVQAIVRDRQRAPRPAVDVRAGPQQRLRRLRAAGQGLGAA